VEIFGSRALYQGRPAVIGIVLDITEKKKLESQLLQAQKMEAVGQLTSGIAHDFNNILSAIIGYGSLLQLKMEADNELRQYTDQILVSADRASHLTNSLLTFSRKQVFRPQPADLNEIIRKVDKLLRRVIGEDIDLRTSLFPRPLIVHADAGQIEQVLMNLATNARDAMQHGGILTIETSVSEQAGRNAAVISVADTGIGMDEKTQEKIFEPFFTTKDLGRGTGLGLSMVYGIITQHGGQIACASELKLGTTFTISLPLVLSDEARSVDSGAEQQDREVLRGSETILVVEDDDSVRGLVLEMLRDAGYRVLLAADGKEGVEQFLANRDAVRLVLCDVIMPRMSGSEVHEAIRRTKPDVKVLFMSGYPAGMIEQKGFLGSGVELVQKPLTPLMLLRKVREVLDKT
jgi:nitrogen-specific signal transduction histidine kinase/CheY-like chemotaxis protein